MKLLLITRLPPSLGGLETMGVLMAREWAATPGLELKVVSSVAGHCDLDEEVEIARCPGVGRLHALYAWADVVFFNNVYIGMALPLCWLRRPYVVSMSGNLEKPNLSKGLVDWLKKKALWRLLSGANRNISACDYVGKFNGVPSLTITNPYDAAVYCHDEDAGPRPFDFLFGGRINQEFKGCYDVVEAFAACCRTSARGLTLSVAGDGPDLAEMKRRVEAHGLGEQVRFLGTLAGRALAEEMRRHRVIVVPSRYQEPIGIICLEGIACGCLAIGSETGGLAESVGPCGLTYAAGDIAALARGMAELVSLSPADVASYRSKAARHLEKYHPATVARQYLAEARAALLG